MGGFRVTGEKIVLQAAAKRRRAAGINAARSTTGTGGWEGGLVTGTRVADESSPSFTKSCQKYFTVRLVQLLLRAVPFIERRYSQSG